MASSFSLEPPQSLAQTVEILKQEKREFMEAMLPELWNRMFQERLDVVVLSEVSDQELESLWSYVKSEDNQYQLRS